MKRKFIFLNTNIIKVYLCYEDKKTLVFDLDETLVHCNDSADYESDITLPVIFPTGESVNVIKL